MPVFHWEKYLYDPHAEGRVLNGLEVERPRYVRSGKGALHAALRHVGAEHLQASLRGGDRALWKKALNDLGFGASERRER